MDSDAASPAEPLPFTDEEYAVRLAAVRERMEAAEIEVMLTAVPENIVYLTGYHSLGYFTFQLLVIPETTRRSCSCAVWPATRHVSTVASST